MLKTTYLKYCGNDSHVWFYPGQPTIITTGDYKFILNDNDDDAPKEAVKTTARRKK